MLFYAIMGEKPDTCYSDLKPDTGFWNRIRESGSGYKSLAIGTMLHVAATYGYTVEQYRVHRSDHTHADQLYYNPIRKKTFLATAAAQNEH